MKKYANKKIIIATHVYATGPALDLRDYLISEQTERLLFIGHPLLYDQKLKGSGYELYEQGEKKVENYQEIKKIPTLISYFKDVTLTIWYVLRTKKRWDLFVGNDPLNAVSGIILKKLGLVKKCSYYVIDYNPRRFQNSVLNRIYHLLDQFCVKNCDESWNLSPRMQEGRRQYFGFSGGLQRVIPIGIWFERFPRYQLEDIDAHSLVFMGHILKKQGVQYVIQAVPKIIEQIKDFRFHVLGGGEYLDELKKQVQDLGIDAYVSFSGFIKDHHEIEERLCRCAVAVAMYELHDEHGNLSFTYFADPGKLKSYLASGLCVLLSDVSYNAKEIEEAGCGKIINNEPDTIASAVISFMRDSESLRQYRSEAVAYASRYNWPDIFDAALKDLL